MIVFKFYLPIFKNKKKIIKNLQRGETTQNKVEYPAI